MSSIITLDTPGVSLPPATVGDAYSFTFNAVSTSGAIKSWQTVDSTGKAIAYSVPAPGLKWGGVNSTIHGLTITGTPTQAITQTFIFKVTDSAGNSVITPPFMLEVLAASGIPPVPDLVSATSGPDEVTLSWTEPA